MGRFWFDQTGCFSWGEGGTEVGKFHRNETYTHTCITQGTSPLDKLLPEEEHIPPLQFNTPTSHKRVHNWTHTNTRVELNHCFTDLWQQSLLLGLRVHLGSLNGSAATKMWLTNREKARRIQGGRKLVLSDLYSLWICCFLTLWN